MRITAYTAAFVAADTIAGRTLVMAGGATDYIPPGG